MTKFTGAILGAAIMATGLGPSAESQQRHRVPVKRATPPALPTEASHSGSTMSVDAQNKLVSYYCSTCHDDEAKTGGLSLQNFDAARIGEHADVAEKMIRKLRTGMMPPPAAKERPDDATLQAFATALEATIDTAAALHPNPGSRPFQRLNRAEYARAVEDLLGIDVDITAFLAPDSLSQGFDNVADAQTFSPTLMEGYLRAASRVTALAVGDVDAQTSEAHYRVSKTASQLQRVDGAPLGTRGGISVAHVFPADGV